MDGWHRLRRDLKYEWIIRYLSWEIVRRICTFLHCRRCGCGVLMSVRKVEPGFVELR